MESIYVKSPDEVFILSLSISNETLSTGQFTDEEETCVLDKYDGFLIFDTVTAGITVVVVVLD